MNESTSNIVSILNKYKVFIGIGIGVAIAIGAGSIFFMNQRNQKAEAAWENLSKINNDLSTALEQKGKDRKERNAALSTAADAYQYMKDTMSSSSATPWAIFQLGNIYYRMENYDEAIRAYNDFLDRYSGHLLAPIVKQSLGYAYEEKGLFPEAIQQFESVPVHDSFLTAQVGWDAGRCYEKSGQTNDAIRSYTRAVELSPKSNWATMSQYRLSVIR
ncbi:MAG: tetratricopeptide repeat protein [Candidatus Jettenia sp.]|uniref:Uncharacterized protein n=1 Tax=Candidatus Jettenia caeni TaxID=247490 RepID=I3INV1_9BACT|nr:tetratricopeptide repeat protein [Candidatus Jettenia sp. AMX1]MBC6927547.1 tetratricopeptide repeat protein [Candidatus Jettenia sp.]WKZ15856.1 MAG: tetratricopeptide repeat protein [Candidatus Jettenia caeni]KAA0251524.1 MAG: tetratricopeptide repeat protein [Candidatus Jettenia sp. AMX1]MCE7881337.1 tetratricopeptide repeat protein [Candidatus Jettenia sp. AMX1]MCQ3926055.1 tetratricopeptide repeat protein [Candidatus Jettenia sp.]